MTVSVGLQTELHFSASIESFERESVSSIPSKTEVVSELAAAHLEHSWTHTAAVQVTLSITFNVKSCEQHKYLLQLWRDD